MSDAFSGNYDAAKMARAAIAWHYSTDKCPKCGREVLTGWYDGVLVRRACLECGWAEKLENKDADAASS